MKLVLALYALASGWFMVALCRATKAGDVLSRCSRVERIKISTKEFP